MVTGGSILHFSHIPTQYLCLLAQKIKIGYFLMGLPLILGESLKSGTRSENRKDCHVSLVLASIEVHKSDPINVFGHKSLLRRVT